MKIHDNQRAAYIQSQKRGVSQQHAQTTGLNKSEPTQDQVKISTEALQLRELSGMSDVEKSKQLDQIREAVQTGSYQVDAKQVAAKIVARIYGEW